MEPDRPVIAWTRTLLGLPPEIGARFPEEWTVVRRRIEIVHAVSLPHETEPATSPRLDPSDG
jgi:hypothetical protein